MSKDLYRAPFLFGFIPAFSLDASATDIVIAFVLIVFGTYGYSWLLMIWMPTKKAVVKVY